MTDDKGNVVHWNFECQPPSILIHAGWTKNLLKPGDQVTVVTRPVRNGAPIGIASKVIPREWPGAHADCEVRFAGDWAPIQFVIGARTETREKPLKTWAIILSTHCAFSGAFLRGMRGEATLRRAPPCLAFPECG